MAAPISIPSLTYKPTSPQGDKWGAQVQLASGASYVISLQNAVADNARALNLQSVLVDCIQNSAGTTITLGNFSFVVPPYTRENFTLPANLSNLQIAVGSGGGAVLTVSEEKLASDQSNYLGIAQQAAATLTYQFVTYAADQAQLSTDLNKSVLFLPTTANMTYTLMLGTAAGNGWLQFLYNQGTKTVTLARSGANTINGVAANVVLDPGDAAILESDGAVWYLNNPLSATAAATYLSIVNAALTYLALSGGTLTGALNNAATATVASATLTNIGAASSNSVIVSGTTTITGLGSIAAGATREVVFSGALLLTHNAVSLILPGGASITTAANDTASFRSLGSGNWICTNYKKADGTAVVASPSGVPVPTSSALAVNTYVLAFYKGLGAVASGNNTSGGNLKLPNGLENAMGLNGATLSGSWKNISGASVADGTVNKVGALWVRTS